jgi:hypothetical protein
MKNGAAVEFAKRSSGRTSAAKNISTLLGSTLKKPKINVSLFITVYFIEAFRELCNRIRSVFLGGCYKKTEMQIS